MILIKTHCDFNRLTYIQSRKTKKNKAMETNNRRDFLKKAALAGASALVAPSLFATGEEGSEISILKNEEFGE